MKAPCMNCTSRHTICHDTCLKYREWKEYCDAQKEHLKKETHPIEADLIRYNSALRAKRRKGK